MRKVIDNVAQGVLREMTINALKQFRQPVAGSGGDAVGGQAAGLARETADQAGSSAADGAKDVDLVQNQNLWRLLCADLAQHATHLRAVLRSQR